MLNKERIENNPLRILGVYVGSPVSVEVNHLNRIRAFSKVGQTVTFPMIGDDFLKPLTRTEKDAENAVQILSLSQDRVENSLLWFSDGTTEWGKVLNDAVQSLLDGDYTRAINCYERLISEEALRESFIESVTHGLTVLSREDLAEVVSEIIITCEDDWSAFWLQRGIKPAGHLAVILFEKVMPEKIETILRSIEAHNLSYKEFETSNIDFYRQLAKFGESSSEIRPILESIEDFYGIESWQYKELAEEFCKKVYTKGSYLVKEIGKFIWEQGPKYRLDDSVYKKYRSRMPIGCVRACMDLITRVDTIVTESIGWVKINDESKRVLYPEISGYETAKRIEFADDDIIRRSVRSFYIKRGITIASWLLFLYWMFWII